MYNWSTDEKYLKKFPRKHVIWKLENLINFGLGKEKISERELVKYFGELKIDPAKRNFLKFILS